MESPKLDAALKKPLKGQIPCRSPGRRQAANGIAAGRGVVAHATRIPSISCTLSIKDTQGDRVLVDGKKLSGPLHPNHRLELPRGYIAHNEIIGKPTRAFVATNTGQKYQLTHPTLEQFISLTPRKVTPVYASYASLIVSLLDIHVAPPTASNEQDPPLEILESGTGHGALTLHLARAVHAANPPPPSLPPPKPASAASATSKYAPSQESDAEDESRAVWAAYRSTRRAVVHSVEVSAPYSAHAQKLIHQFCRGMYAPHIDFHVASVGDWIHAQLAEHSSAEPFLSHAILDMPASHLQIAAVAPAMKDGALLVVFVPSVTQIGDCVKIIQDKGLKLQMEKVLELGEGISNGRVWDVRLATKRTRSNETVSVSPIERLGADKGLEEEGEGPSADAVGSDADVVLQSAGPDLVRPADDQSVMVCRPKVGRMTIGGGFIGLWRKMDTSA